MARVLGLGGVFFKAQDPKALAAWYQTNLGITLDPPYGDDCFGASLRVEGLPADAMQVWSIFSKGTEYFGRPEQQFLINFLVDDVPGLLAQVEAGGGKRLGDVQEESYGTFGWFEDPEGNKVELWSPHGSEG